VASVFTLELWQPVRTDRSKLYAPSVSGGAGSASLLPVTSDRFYQQIHSWTVAEDVFGDVRDANLREALRTGFHGAFTADCPREERSIEHLATFLRRLMHSLTEAEPEWLPSQADMGSDDEDERRFPGRLALANHLTWLVESFGEVPGIFVTVR
jgi:hypothetical protein